MANCNCPNTDALQTIPKEDCPFDFKQIQKIAFVKAGKVLWDDGGNNTGVPQTDSKLENLADWEARTTAADDTKIVISPFIGADPIIEAGEAVTEGGGDNSTLNGVEVVTGTNPSNFSAMFKSLSPAQEKALKSLPCNTLEVYFFLEGGRIIAEKIPNDADERARGLRIETMFVGDRNNEGYGTRDTNMISFVLPAGWSENIIFVNPEFNPLYDL